MDIYTDASVRGKKHIGIGMFIIDEQEREYKYNQHYKGNDLREDLSEKGQPISGKIGAPIGEAYAVLKALKMLNDKGISGIIYTDSLNTVDMLYGLGKSSASDLQTKLIQLCKDELVKINNDTEVRWIKGHAGVYGNVKADNLAYKALIKQEILNNIEA